MPIETHPNSAEYYRLYKLLCSKGVRPFDAGKWFRAIHPELDGMTPITAIEAGQSAKVEQLIQEQGRVAG